MRARVLMHLRIMLMAKIVHDEHVTILTPLSFLSATTLGLAEHVAYHRPQLIITVAQPIVFVDALSAAFRFEFYMTGCCS